MGKISKTHHKTWYIGPNLSDGQKWVIEAYEYLIPYNTTITTTEFAELIKQHYDLSTRRNEYAYYSMLSLCQPVDKP